MTTALSQLVLVDILAALPMAHVVRVARLGHGRLRRTCSLKWVTDRMTDVNFEAAVSAHRAGAETRDVFCTESVLKRLHGRVTVSIDDLIKDTVYFDACVVLANKVFGRILLCIKGGQLGGQGLTYTIRYQNIEPFIRSLHEPKIVFFIIVGTSYIDNLYVFKIFPNLIFHSMSSIMSNSVAYNYRRLNGRNIVDVFRAVSDPSLHSTLTLDRAREMATENMHELSNPIRDTIWHLIELKRKVTHH